MPGVLDSAGFFARKDNPQGLPRAVRIERTISDGLHNAGFSLFVQSM